MASLLPFLKLTKTINHISMNLSDFSIILFANFKAILFFHFKSLVFLQLYFLNGPFLVLKMAVRLIIS